MAENEKELFQATLLSSTIQKTLGLHYGTIQL